MHRPAFVLAIALTWSPAVTAKAADSPIKADEEVVFYPTFARQTDGGRSWQVAIHGSIFESEERSLKRAFLVRLIREAIPRKLSPAEEETFRRRVRLFLVDSERGKSISIRLGSMVLPAGTSEADGHFQSGLRLSEEQIRALAGVGRSSGGWVSFSAATRPGDRRTFVGCFLPIGPEGLSVVSDIDDTIKVSNVRDRQELLANTFLRRFEAVPDMASTYRFLAERGAVFHYVSASPWQLYPPLADFLREAGFPGGTVRMKSVRLVDSSALSLFGSQEGYKTPEIEALLKAFPLRRFVLIGDSGEQDPEIFADLARRHGDQIRAIWIRNVSRETPDNPRCTKAFSGLPPARWFLFRDAAELRDRARGIVAGQ